MQRLETRRLGERARDVLLGSIRDGAFPDGLPSEDRLAEQLGISRTTVREALLSLEDEGIITRQRGVGTRVNEHVLETISLNRLDGFYELISDAGYEPEIAWTTVRAGPVTLEAARRLGLDEGADVLNVERLFLADGQPVIQLLENVPLAEITVPVEADNVPDSIFTFAETYCRAGIDHTVVELLPGVADGDGGSLLPLAPGSPFLRLLETHYAADGNPIIVSVIDSDHRVLRFSVVRKRMGWTSRSKGD